ncbi:MAG: hypothetical protein WAW39_18455 [Prosthecobacter sp.]|uniref:hypothetical protein n=1 Tax=Prosthecobacter sp. TaxID=1965333 RepID=UPI003BB161E7
MNDKIIITNKTALSQKYGKEGLTKINKALKDVLKADANRGIKTSVIYLDDEAAMKKLGGVAVTTASSPKQNKDAIDAIAKAASPDYLMILGAPDVVPHQDLINPAFDPGNDDDANAEGDLPYACDVPYSRDPAKFVGPARVVGRLPDLAGASDPAHLISLLAVAAGYQSRPAQNYAKYFGLSAHVWKGSTTLSLENVFGNATSLLTSPTAGPSYPQGEMKALTHFINCHGGEADPQFYGQKGSSYPPSVTTKDAAGQIKEGTVAAAECCYGGELYDSETLGIDMPICQSYLRQGAYGFFGSTTIAYGPADSNGSADYICQDFLIQVLGGASLGRAALIARQHFVERNSQMDPFDLKTLAQFCLLGDPSVQPVAAAGDTKVAKGTTDASAERFARAERRVKLKQMGEFLSQTKPTASKKVRTGRVTPTTKAALANIAKKAGIGDAKPFSAFAVRNKAPKQKRGGKSEAVPSRYFINVWKPKKTHDGLHLGVGVVAKELNGRIVDYRIYYQR